MKHDRTFENLFRGIAFFWPLYVVGLPIGGFDFTLVVLLLVFLSGLVLARGTFWTRTVGLGGLFVGWAFLTAFPRHPVQEYIFSWFALGVMIIPFLGTYPLNIRQRRILDALYWGVVVSFVFAAYEIAINFTSLPPVKKLLPIGLWPEVRTHEYLGLRRIKATMAEPAHYAIYLVFAYGILDFAEDRGYSFKHQVLFKAAWSISLLATLSLSGVILAVSYFAARFLQRWREGVYQLFRPRFWLFLATAPIVLSGALYAVDITPGELFSLFADRLGDVIQVIQLGAVAGSEGSRVQSTLILFEYLGRQDWGHFFFGEGYAQYDIWIQNRYGHLSEQITSLASGSLHNRFSVIGLSTGFIGLLIYIAFAAGLLFSRTRFIPFTISVTWIVAHFAIGSLIGGHLWIPLLITGITCRDLENPRVQL